MRVAVATGRAAERPLAFSVAVELFEPLWRAASSPTFQAELSGGPAGAAVRMLDSPEPSSPLSDGGYAITRGMWLLARRLAEMPQPSPRGAPRLASARPGGLAMIVDDLQDVDGPTLGLLAYAAHRLESAPVAILTGCRTDVEPCAPAAVASIARAARVLVPEPLIGKAGATLVRSVLPGASARFAEACVSACAGNPALLRALVVGLAQDGVSGSEADADRVGPVVPEGVAALVAERVARLQGPARAFVRAAAALDRPGALDQVADIAGLSIDAAREVFDTLVDADVLLPDPSPTFAQPIVRLAVRASLTPGQRAGVTPSADRPAGGGRERVGRLTPSENRVAGLAAHGMTTRQIAATLFVTPKTVEFHLRNVYAKLEIPSTRAALAWALDVPEPVPSAE